MADKPTRPVQLPGKKPTGTAKPDGPPAGAKKPAGLPAGSSAGAKKPAGPPGARPAAGPKMPPGPRKPKRTKSKLEDIKAQSHGLRGDLQEDLQQDEDHFDEAGKQLLKFHGIYQQDDRDRRSEDRFYYFMVRTRLPGGELTADQYLALDALADRYGNDTLRITTRQGFQFHGVLKGDLKHHLKALNENLITTLSACGDVVRNVMCCPFPSSSPIYRTIQETTQRLSTHLLPRTKAYHDVWLNGEKVYTGKEAAEEEDPLYGKAYLPRKFKVGIAPPGDNCIDAYTQDIGLIAVADGDTLRGFNVVVGGGLGMTHKKPETFPRLADPLAFITPDEVLPVVTEIIGIQRDHGDRKDRRHARMKYLIHDWGLDRFRDELEKRLGRPLAPPAEMPPLQLDLHLGWQPQGDGHWCLGLSVENGRIQDEGGLQLKTGLRAVIERFRPGVRLTPNQDVLLTDLHEDDRAELEEMLSAYGIALAETLSNARKYSMACPAMPTCGLALAESERVMPGVIDQFESVLSQHGLQDEQFGIRMTGCPNGCARPYISDIGFVGRSPDRYAIFLGGRMDGTRLNQPFKDLVSLDELVDTVEPLLVFFKQERQAEESFGDFCHRLGIETLQQFAESYQPHDYAS